MSVTTMESPDKWEITIQINGRFDFSCHQEFTKAYKAYTKGEKRYRVDLSKTEYMDSSAMGMLLQLREYADANAGVVLANANSGVREILKVANFEKLFTVL